MSNDNAHHPLTHTALAKLSRAVYEKFGEQALPLIRDAWYDMGTKAGTRIAKKKGISTFREAADDHVEMVMGFGDVYEFCHVTDDVYHAKSRKGTPCDVRMDGAGAAGCHACMAVNVAQFEAICGAPVDLEVSQSRALGDDSCDVKYTLRK